MISNIQDRSKLQQQVEKLISSRLGKPVQCQHQAELCPGKRRSRKTDYVRFSCPAIKEGVFVKYAEKLRFDSALESFLATQPFSHFTVPVFFGDGRIDGNMFGVWEYLPYQPLKDFSDCAGEAFMAIVQAAASIGMATAKVKRAVPTLRSGAAWLRPIAAELKTTYAKLEGRWANASAADQLDLFGRIESRAIDRLRGLGNSVFCHNDLSPSNTIYAQGRLYILDWESASLSVAGSSLRNLTVRPVPDQRLAAAIYADGLRERGFEFEADDIFFAMGATQFFFKLRMALHVRSLGEIEKNLELLKPLVADRL
jgi:hypothetical protein